jgi:hypothetical protein
VFAVVERGMDIVAASEIVFDTVDVAAQSEIVAAIVDEQVLVDMTVRMLRI